MQKTIAIINGHPDANPDRYCHALTKAYEDGARSAGHIVHRIDIANSDFPILRSADEFKTGKPPNDILAAQNAILEASHLVIIYPLWLGTMPALLKAFMEQVFRPEFAFSSKANGWPKKLLKGRSAHIIVTMGMPAFAYRWFFFAHSLKSLQRNVLKFCGFNPVRNTIIGLVESISDRKREKWLDQVTLLGRHGR